MPSSSGVYWFLNTENKVLYVGKAKKLKTRVSSYTKHQHLTPRIKKMVTLASKLKFLELGSELEALLTEAELIRIYQPPFNILLKDDKSPLYLQITNNTFPKVLIKRKQNIVKNTTKGTILGPFTSSYKLKEVLKIARKIFPWCNKKTHDGKPCFYYHIDLCPGACINKITVKKYQQTIKELTLFLQGKKKTVTTNLKLKMKQAIKEERFEDAAKVRDQLKLIKEVTRANYKLKPEVTSVGLKDNINQDGLIYLQQILAETLQLPKKLPLKRIEGYDVSNTQGTNPAVSMVVFINGEIKSSEYRIFNIKTLNTPNDFAMMQEALTRRQNHSEWGVASLILLDGGKGQVKAVLKVWSSNTPIIGLAKNPDRIVIPIINYSNWQENKKEVLKNLKYKIIKLKNNHPTLKLLQQIRDESHRFAQNQHKKIRLEQMFK